MQATIIASPIVAVINRYTLTVRFTLNHHATYLADVGSEHANPSAELTAQFNTYAAEFENGIKDGWPDWSTKDTSRNATWELAAKQTPGEYLCMVEFDIVGAVVETSITVETALTGSELTAFLQDQANQAMNQWLAAHPQLVEIP